MGTSHKERQQWVDLTRDDAVQKLRELADHVEKDTLQFAGEPIALTMLSRVKVALRSEGDRFTVVQKLKAHRSRDATEGTAVPALENESTAPNAPPATTPPPARVLAWSPLKRALKQHYRRLYVVFRQGRLPVVEDLQWLRDATARQQELRGDEDPAFARFADLAEALLTAVEKSAADRAQELWLDLCKQHRACHRSRK